MNLEYNEAESRMNICKKCPLYKKNEIAGAICNSRLFLNPDTGEVSEIKKPGFKSGCGCRLDNKTKTSYARCPLGKW